jgi:hypothetical protein
MSAWDIRIEYWRDGLCGEMGMTATRKCGRTEPLTLYRFPAGWRLGRTTAVPKAVQAEALRVAKLVMP